MRGLSICLTHKVMAIGLFGLVGLIAFGAIYEMGTVSQDASRDVANRARAITDLNKQLTIEMLEPVATRRILSSATTRAMPRRMPTWSARSIAISMRWSG